MILITNRTRSRYVIRKDGLHPSRVTNLGGEIVNDYSSDTVNLPNHLFAEYPSFQIYERISDVIGKKRDANGRFPSTAVSRFAIQARLKDVPSYAQTGGNSVSNVRRFDTYLTPTLFEDHLPPIPDDLWYDLAEAAFNDFATQIPDEISVANFGWELKEIGQLLPRLSKSLSESISGLYLNLEFGWKPFLGDLNTLYNLLSTVQSKIQHLRDTWGKETRLGSYRGNCYEAILNDSSFTYQAFDIVKFHYTARSYRADFRAGGYLYHELQGLNDTYGFIRALIVSLGLSNPLKVVWNAIPYSFVSDWFTGLSGKLDALSVNPFKGTWIVSRRSTSVKEVMQWDIGVEFTGDVTNSFKNLGVIRLGTVDAQRYRRLGELPVRSDFLTSLTSPTAKQQSLLLALLNPRHG